MLKIGRERLYEMMRFVIVGVLATAIQYVVYRLALPYVSASLAFTVGTVVSVLCNYGMSSRITFRVGMSFERFVGFAMSHATNYFIQIVLLNLFLGIGVEERLAPLPVYVLAVPINYFTVRFALTRRSHSGDGYWLFLMSVGFAMLWLQLLDVPTLSDDMLYRFAWQADDSHPVQAIGGLSDLLRSQWVHYTSANGRLVPHLLAQTFLVFLPPVVLQVLNTLLFVLLVHLSVTSVGVATPRGRMAMAAVVCTLLFVVFSGFRTTMLWGLGALNYLWPLVGVLLLLLWQRRTVGSASPPSAVWAVAPLAFMAGWSHEALSLPVSAAFALWLALHRRQLGRQRVVVATMLLFMAGTALCLLTPSLWHRVGDATSLQSRLLAGAVNCVLNIRVVWLLLIVLAVARLRRREAWSRHLRTHAYAYLALAVAFGIVLLYGVTLERVAFFTDFIAMLLLLRLAVKPLTSRPAYASPLFALCCVVLLTAYVPAYMVRSENAAVWRMAEAQMRQPGRELIAVPTPQKGKNWLMDCLREHYANPSFTFGFYSSYMGFDATDVNMRCAARLYGKQRMAFLPADVVERIEADSTAYATYALDRNADLYVWRMDDGRPVTAVTFVLADEDPSQLLPHQRLVAYKGSEYALDSFCFETVSVCGRTYLVFTKPTTNVCRRISSTRITH